jgi:hypothetical protein
MTTMDDLTKNSIEKERQYKRWLKNPGAGINALDAKRLLDENRHASEEEFRRAVFEFCYQKRSLGSVSKRSRA